MGHCKLCNAPPGIRNKVDKLLRDGIQQKVIVGLMRTEAPELSLNTSNVSYHFNNHMDTLPDETGLTGVSEAELNRMERPDIVAIVHRQVNKYEALEKIRKLTQSEELYRQRFLELLLKLEIAKMQRPEPKKTEAEIVENWQKSQYQEEQKDEPVQKT